MSNEATTPDKILTIEVNGAKRDIKMTYGLLNELLRAVPNIDNVASVFADPEARTTVLKAVLAERSSTGRVTTEVDPEDVNIEIETVDDILSWAAAHVTSFFMRSLINLTKQVNRLPAQELEAVVTEVVDGASTSTSNGSES